MAELSPQAQAVLASIDDLFNYGCPEDHDIAAAVLRAAADQVVPEETTPWNSTLIPMISAREVRAKLLAIVTELEAVE
jgi:hypothetical protein